MRYPSSQTPRFLTNMDGLTHQLRFLAYWWIVPLLTVLFVLCFPLRVNVYYLSLSVHFGLYEVYISSDSGVSPPRFESQLCHSLSNLEQLT